MDFGLLTFSAALAAGSLSTLSPCVLPLVPILIGSALGAHRYGVVALAAGLALSFTAVGVFIASIGVAIGLDQLLIRQIAAVLFVVFGLVLLSPALQAQFAARTAGLSAAGGNILNRITLDGMRGQFVVGLLLGVVWTPCVGPTLGAAVSLATQGESLAQVALVMTLFGIGAAAPLVILGLVSRQAFVRLRGKLLDFGKRGKLALGAVLLLVGILVLTGVDKTIEIWLTSHAPEWWIRLTTTL
jgi:cytochrome c-type biogenesis protein